MPNILINNLGLIDGLTIGNQIAQMTQPADSLQCGAYALLAAANAFGSNPPVAAATAISYVTAGITANSQTLQSTDDYPTLAAAVYAVTGILNPAPTRDTQLVQNGGGNSPAAMSQVIVTLVGTVVPVNVYVTEDGYAVLGGLYPGELARCQAVMGTGVYVGTSGVPVNYQEASENQTQLICVWSGPPANDLPGTTLHWLARGGSGGAYYDSATGNINNVWPDPDSVQFPTDSDYTFAGLWITIGPD